jgi:hypothetical protein
MQIFNINLLFLGFGCATGAEQGKQTAGNRKWAYQPTIVIKFDGFMCWVCFSAEKGGRGNLNIKKKTFGLFDRSSPRSST